MDWDLIWNTVWNFMAVMGLLFTVSCIFLLIVIFVRYRDPNRNIADPRIKNDIRKDEANDRSD